MLGTKPRSSQRAARAPRSGLISLASIRTALFCIQNEPYFCFHSLHVLRLYLGNHVSKPTACTPGTLVRNELS